MRTFTLAVACINFVGFSFATVVGILANNSLLLGLGLINLVLAILNYDKYTRM